MRVLWPALAATGVFLLFDGLTAPSRRSRAPLLPGLERLAHEAGGAWLTGGRLLAFATSGALLTVLVVAGLTSSLVIALAFAAIAFWTPFAILRARRLRRMSLFRAAWPDAIGALIAGVRAGLSLAECCVGLVQRGPPGLQRGFAALAATYRATGSFHAGLERLRTELSDPVADRVVVALALAHDVGGTDLVRILRTLGDFVREDLRVRREVQARWSWTITAARVAAAAPWLVLLAMASRPEAARAYNSRTGAVVVLVGAGATILGYRLMIRAARLPEESRLSE
jgi:tight adherence protein B